MSNQLKKEFKKADVERMRNLVKKDYTASTKQQTGYRKVSQEHEEGDIWEENGRKWTIKNGLKQNITKLDAAKKALQVPLTCPKCAGSMSYHLSKETYKKSKMCFNCYTSYVGELKRSGLYEQYLLADKKGNIKFFIKAFEEKIAEVENASETTFVTETGDIESWNVDLSVHKERITSELQEYLKFLKAKLD